MGKGKKKEMEEGAWAAANVFQSDIDLHINKMVVWYEDNTSDG